MSASIAMALAQGTATILAPHLAVGVLTVNAAATLAVHFAQSSARTPASAAPPAATPGDTPLVSIHVPVHNEPSALVIATLDALARLRYPRFEVIVLDNNTPDPAVWRPVQRHCASLGPRFRFFNRDGVRGAKAGALTLTRALADPAAGLIAVVDADYMVEPDFLGTAMPHFADAKVAFVQFPQAYRGVTAACADVEQELSEYFRSHGAQSNTTGSMLLTGTLSVIRARALDAVGGWSGETVTEDAELGARLWAAGFAGVYVERVMGRGLLPFSLDGLRAQRHRWVAGNVQTLLRAAGDLARGRLGRRSIIGQLTTWPMFWLVPTATLLAGALTTVLGDAPASAVNLAGATMLGSLAVLVARNARRDGVVAGLQAAWVRLALAWCSSRAVLDGVARRRLEFVRTPKSASARRAVPGDAVLALAGLAGVAAFLDAALPIPAAACVLIALGGIAARDVDGRLRGYALRVAGDSTPETGGPHRLGGDRESHRPTGAAA